MERHCEVCRRWFDSTGRQKTCSEDCRQERIFERQTSVEVRFKQFERILNAEKIYPRDDPMAHNEHFYAALIEAGCTYCGVSLESSTGICIDRLQTSQDRRPVKHNSWSITPCCPVCNRIKSDSQEGSGFSFAEMGTIIGPAIRECRIRRGNTRKR